MPTSYTPLSDLATRSMEFPLSLRHPSNLDVDSETIPWYMEGELTLDEGSKTTVVRTPMLHHSKDYIDPRLIC